MNQPTTRGAPMTRVRSAAPACTATDDGDATVTQDCPLCGWSATWAADQDGGRQ